MEGFHLPQRQISLQKQPPQVFWKKKCSQQIRKIHWKTPEQSLFFHKVAGFSLWKQRLWHRWFYVNFVTFVRTIFFTEHLWAIASVILRTQNLSLQSTFLIKLYHPEENPTVSQTTKKDVQCFLCSVVCILNSGR